MTVTYSELLTSTQEKIDSDADFQNSLAELSEEDKTQAITTKQQELLDGELKVLEEKATKAEEIAHNQKIRAEKAESEAKRTKEKETPKNDVTSKKEQVLEARALNSIHEDDIEEVVAIAEAKKISLLEAVKNPYVKAFIKTREDERKTAEATNTGSNRKVNSKTDEESLLKRAEKGELTPEEMKSAAKATIAQMSKR